jgi:hypothetical protein
MISFIYTIIEAFVNAHYSQSYIGDSKAIYGDIF